MCSERCVWWSIVMLENYFSSTTFIAESLVSSIYVPFFSCHIFAILFSFFFEITVIWSSVTLIVGRGENKVSQGLPLFCSHGQHHSTTARFSIFNLTSQLSARRTVAKWTKPGIKLFWHYCVLLTTSGCLSCWIQIYHVNYYTVFNTLMSDSNCRILCFTWTRGPSQRGKKILGFWYSAQDFACVTNAPAKFLVHTSLVRTVVWCFRELYGLYTRAMPKVMSNNCLLYFIIENICSKYEYTVLFILFCNHFS